MDGNERFPYVPYVWLYIAALISAAAFNDNVHHYFYDVLPATYLCPAALHAKVGLITAAFPDAAHAYKIHHTLLMLSAVNTYSAVLHS